MILTELQINSLRNIRSLTIKIDPFFTVISGKNGSGKTSVLEAVYLLSCARSFRARESASLISYGQDSLTVFAKIIDNQQVALKKGNHGFTTALINNRPCLSTSELAYFIPCQLLYADLFDFINTGPSVRRAILDWGVFHMDCSFAPIYKKLRFLLKQKNALLKQKKPGSLHNPWNTQIHEVSELIHQKRELYVNRLSSLFPEILTELTQLDCFIRYDKGWDKKKEGLLLESILAENFSHDVIRQRTQFGPHNADLQIISNQSKVKHGLSRGQQKIVMFALKFAQARLLNKPCVYLIDDLESELDTHHVMKVVDYLIKIKAQVVVTAHSGKNLLDYLSDRTSVVLEEGNLLNSFD